MSLTPDWAPNIHPLIVHFPIAFLVMAALADLAGVILKGRKSVRDFATLLYAAGAVCAVMAYMTGRNAGDTVLLPAMATALVDEHSDWAFRTTWFFAFFASIRLALSFIVQASSHAVTGAAFVAGLAGLYMLFETAERGGRLVFEHGVGVQVAAAPSQEVADIPTDGDIDPGLIDLENGSSGRPTSVR